MRSGELIDRAHVVGLYDHDLFLSEFGPNLIVNGRERLEDVLAAVVTLYDRDMRSAWEFVDQRRNRRGRQSLRTEMYGRRQKKTCPGSLNKTAA
jgi:hypothetical protein